MTDIVERLRKCANTVYQQDGYTFRLGLQNEAADEIERLREALQFYTCGCKEDRCTPDKQRFRDIKCGWVAREALEGK